MAGLSEWQHVAENLRRLRRARGFTQAALARASGVAKPTIANIERGARVAGTSIRIYGRLSETLRVPIWVLLENGFAGYAGTVPGTKWDGASYG